jgi:ABC-type amino acid transport system permease subunit
LAGTLSACSDKELYSAPEDLSGAKVGLLNVELPQDSLYKVMPDAEFKEYGKFMQLFLDLNAGRCDAAVVDSAMAAEATGKNSGYVLIGNVCGYHAIVHESRCEHIEQYSITSIGWWKNWKNRLERGLLNGDAASLLLKGLYTTVVIFFFAAIFAILLAAILTYMAIKHRWVYIYKPMSWMVSVLHDIPPVVLMMFFYYVVFVSSGLSGVVVSIIALGIYTSGSLYKIFKIHIMQVGKEQRESAFMLGLKERQAYHYVILPQAIKSSMPLMAGELKLLLRSTSYAGYIAQKDLVKAVDAIRALTFDSFVPLLIVSLIYLLLSWLIGKGLNTLYVKFIKHD